MTREEFISLVGQDVVVDYPFMGELQQWSMKSFYLNEVGDPYHRRLPLIMDVFIRNCRNPHVGKATHG